MKQPGFGDSELAAIRTGLREVSEGSIEVNSAAALVARLYDLWRPIPYLAEGVPRYAALRRTRSHEDQPYWLIGATNEFIKATTSIDRKLQGRILEAIGYIMRTPTSPKGDTVKPLGGDLKDLWRYRIGDYRLVYRPDPEAKKVFLVAFTARGDAYA